MASIGIIGAGVAGLHLGLFLRQHGIQATIYTEKTAGEQFGSRLPGLVARAWHTRERERLLGVNFWDNTDNEFGRANIYLLGEELLAFHSDLPRPWITVDMRIYFGRLLEVFAARGGELVIGEVGASDLERISNDHDLLVVATGRGGLSGLFPRIAEYSPFSSPPRQLTVGLFRGVAPSATPQTSTMHIVPEQGEIFEFQIYSFEPHVTGVALEAIPGGAFEPLARMNYEADPQGFNAAMLEVLRQYAPGIYGRVDAARFELTRGLDLLQGGITPTVRQGHIRLGNGKYALSLGDVRAINDPIIGQGANTASRTAWMLGEAIVQSQDYDEAFCRRVEEQVWAYAGPVAAWSNMMLQPPPPHLVEYMVAASQHQAIADRFVLSLEGVVEGSRLMTSAENMTAYLKSEGWQGMPEARMAA